MITIAHDLFRYVYIIKQLLAIYMYKGLTKFDQNQ